MDFQEFVQMPKRDETFPAPERKTLPESISDASKVAAWLADNYDYWRHFSGKDLAKDFVKEAKSCTSANGCPAFDQLVVFASLDKNHDAELDFPEAFPILPTDKAGPELQWSR